MQYKSYIEWPGIDPGLLGERQTTNSLNHAPPPVGWFFFFFFFFFFIFFVNELCNSVCIRTSSPFKNEVYNEDSDMWWTSVEVVETWYIVTLWDATHILSLREVSYLPKKSERYEYPSFISSYRAQFHTTHNVELTTVRLKQFKPWKCRHVGT